MKIENIIRKYLIEEIQFKSGDWVSGVALGTLMDIQVEGVYISKTSGQFHLLSIYNPQKPRKIPMYIQIHSPKKVPGKKDEKLLSLAMKHSLWEN
jgi:hypothetical protein